MSAFFKWTELGTWKVGNYCSVPPGTCVMKNCDAGYVTIETLGGRGLLHKQLVTDLTKEDGSNYTSMMELMTETADFFKQE